MQKKRYNPNANTTSTIVVNGKNKIVTSQQKNFTGHILATKAAEAGIDLLQHVTAKGRTSKNFKLVMQFLFNHTLVKRLLASKQPITKEELLLIIGKGNKEKLSKETMAMLVGVGHGKTLIQKKKNPKKGDSEWHGSRSRNPNSKPRNGRYGNND